MRDVKKILEEILCKCNFEFDEQQVEELQKYLDNFVGDNKCEDLSKDILFIIHKGVEVWAVKNISLDCMTPAEFLERFMKLYCSAAL